MSECFYHEKSRRQDSPCLYCEIDDLEQRIKKLEKQTNILSWVSATEYAKAKRRYEQYKKTSTGE